MIAMVLMVTCGPLFILSEDAAIFFYPMKSYQISGFLGQATISDRSFYYLLYLVVVLNLVKPCENDISSDLNPSKTMFLSC